MIVNGNFYNNTSAEARYTTETNQADALASHMKENTEQKSNLSDSVQLSPEAYAALKEYAPDSLAVLGYNDENPVLEEVKEIAKEKYFHFGSQYLKLPETTDDMISALDVANRFMDALNSIEPDEIYERIADENSADSGDFIRRASIFGANELIYG
jgi:hypothetical protein